MKYMLGLLFLYHRYHRDGLMRVWADDQLVHEINLKKDIKLKIIDKSKSPVGRQISGPMNQCNVAFVPEKLFLFEIDESNLQKNLRLEIVNDYNNHTNGFMTEYSYVNFQGMFLIPECLMHFENWKKIDRLNNTNMVRWPIEQVQNLEHISKALVELANNLIVTKSVKDLKTILGKLKGTFAQLELCKSQLPARNHSEALDEYPPEFSEPFRRAVVTGEMKNKSYRYIWATALGGSFNLEFPLYRKHNIIHLVRPLPGKKKITREIAQILWLFKRLNIAI